MHPTDLDRALRTALWQIRVGWITVAAMLVARLATLALQLGGGSLEPILFGQAVLKSSVLLAVVLLYRRYVWPAYLMLGVWLIGFVFAWRSVHAPPTALGVGLLVGAGLFLGARGVRALHAQGTRRE